MSARFNVGRFPEEESDDLYPGLSVYEQRQEGKITVADSQTPAVAPIRAAIEDRDQGALGFEEIESDSTNYGNVTRKEIADFVEHLLSAPNELGRLLLILADNERQFRQKEENSVDNWWNDSDLRQRCLKQLRRCLRLLGPRKRRERAIPSLAPENERQTIALLNLLNSDSAVDAAARALWTLDGHDKDDGPKDDNEHSRYFTQAIAAVGGISDQVVEDLGIAEHLGKETDEQGRVIIDPKKMYKYFGIEFNEE
jgi:hypothetical protein